MIDTLIENVQSKSMHSSLYTKNNTTTSDLKRNLYKSYNQSVVGHTLTRTRDLLISSHPLSPLNYVSMRSHMNQHSWLCRHSEHELLEARIMPLDRQCWKHDVLHSCFMHQTKWGNGFVALTLLLSSTIWLWNCPEYNDWALHVLFCHKCCFDFVFRTAWLVAPFAWTIGWQASMFVIAMLSCECCCFRFKSLSSIGCHELTYSLRGLNPRPMAHKTIALTTELRELKVNVHKHILKDVTGNVLCFNCLTSLLGLMDKASDF